MNRRIRSIALSSESSAISRLLLAFAVMLIALFAWTLAQAAPVDGVKGHDAAYGLQPANIAIKTLAIDSLTDREAALFAPAPPAPSYETNRDRPRIRETN